MAEAARNRPDARSVRRAGLATFTCARQIRASLDQPPLDYGSETDPDNAFIKLFAPCKRRHVVGIASLHVYDKNPAARFVFIDGQRAKEGDVLANGIRVDEIRADGAVLSFRGARFLVPIQ